MTRLGKILLFGHIIKDPGKHFYRKMWFVVGIFTFKLNFDDNILYFLVWRLFWLFFLKFGQIFPNPLVTLEIT